MLTPVFNNGLQPAKNRTICGSVTFALAMTRALSGTDLLVLAVLLAFAFGFLKPRIWQKVRFPGSSEWPTQQATVQRQLVRSYSGRGGTTYRAELGYYYQVNGEFYSGYYEGDMCSSEGEADALIKRYPVGAALQVHVHPAKPAVSVLSLEHSTAGEPPESETGLLT